MRALRIIIITVIVLSLGTFFWFTAETDVHYLLFERIMVTDQRMLLLVLLLGVMTLFSTLTGLPVLYFSMALGFLLDFTSAFMISLVMNLLSVMAAYYMVRRVFTDYFREKYGQKKLIKRIEKKIKKYGLWTVVFSRGIYIVPTNVINFSFPLSSMSTRSYFLGTALGLLPECLINVLTGYLVKHETILLSTPETRTWQALIIGGFILLFILAFILIRIRQGKRKKYRALNQVPYE